MDQLLVTRIVEAALLASTQPLTMAQLGNLFPLDQPPPEDGIARALQDLRAQSAARGIELVEVASGWRFQIQADIHPWVARLWNERQTKYTRATLETLALIAYRQPITRGEIEQIRGVAVNSSIIKALEEREWIRVVGHRDMPGKPELLGTTKAFLDYFGLQRLDDLPPLSELKDFAELDPQMQLQTDPIPACTDPAANDDDSRQIQAPILDAGSDEAPRPPTTADGAIGAEPACIPASNADRSISDDGAAIAMPAPPPEAAIAIDQAILGADTDLATAARTPNATAENADPDPDEDDGSRSRQ